MTVAYTGDKGEPELVPSGASPTFAADVTEVAAWLQKGRSFRREDDQAALAAATGMDDLDLAMVDAIPGAWFKYDGTAGDWIMHGVAVFDDATARDAAITAPAAGMRCELADTGFTYRYSGSAWVVVAGDTGWQNITLAGTWATSGGLTPQYRVLNGVVHLRGSVSGGGSTTLGTLPAGARPGQASTFPLIHSTGITITRIDIATTGVMTMNSAAAVPFLHPVQFPADN